MRFAFLGTPELSVICLEQMKEGGFMPALVVTQPDMPSGRGRVLTPPAVKVWADAHNIPIVQPSSINSYEEKLRSYGAFDCFVLVAYGQIVRQNIIDIPTHGIINMHPSLLPHLRGPSPIRTALLQNLPEDVGVTIMQIDRLMDHGPILLQQAVTVPQWPMRGRELDTYLATIGGTMLATVLTDLPTYIATATEQDHDKATLCHFIQKSDAFISLSDDPMRNYRKICAYDGWPECYTFVEKKGIQIRIKITAAHLEHPPSGPQLIIDTIIPEGKSPMSYADFIR